jgi:type I restriction enzyme S subunit
MRQWPKVALGEVLTQNKTYIDSLEPKFYKKLSVKLYGKGVVLDTPANGAEVRMTKHQLASKGQVILSEIWGKKGAIGIVPEEGEGALCTSHFFLFDIDESKVMRGYLRWLFTGNYLETQLDAKAKGTTGYAAVRPSHFLVATIPLPTINEQRAIVDRLDVIAEKAQQVAANLNEIEADAERLLAIRFRETIENAEWRPMAEVAPLVRREVQIDTEESYTELGIRSFYKGAFHRRTLSGAEYTWQNLYWVKTGDLIFSNIMAWEQAIAIAKEQDHNCVGNHRMLTCAPVRGTAIPGFLWYYFTTADGFAKILAASPGTAARNKTLKGDALMAIQVPIPNIAKQQAFDKLQYAVTEIKAKHSEIRKELNAMLPSMLEQVFQKTPTDNKLSSGPYQGI